MDVQKLMKQAQKMQASLVKAQEEIAGMTFEGTSGGGAVKAITSGEGLLKTLTISQDVIKDGDPELLADLVITAVNSALDAGKKFTQQRMTALTGGLGLPGF